MQFIAGKTGGIVHSLATHPKRNEIIFARRRDIYIYSSDDNEAMEVI